MNINNHLTSKKKYKVLNSSLHSIYRLVNSTYEPKELVRRLSRLICQIFNARSCLIVLLDPTKKYSVFKCLISDRKKYIVDKKIRMANRLEKRIVNTLTSVRKDFVMGLPLVCEDVMGIIVIKRNKKDAAFDKFDQEMLMTICEQAIIGIKSLQLYEEQQKIILGSIKSLSTILDMRVPREYTHSPFFSRLVSLIAQQMHIDEKQIETIKYASILHDAGKADIPLKILTKPTKLTPQEYGIIKSHPIKSAQILRPLQILKPVMQIIMHHHEKYDGSGYPSGLKKGQIPQGSRIMAVADAFEAMVYGRPYRERMDISSAIKEIKKKSGMQFDPKVVEAFLKAIKKVKTKKYLSC